MIPHITPKRNVAPGTWTFDGPSDKHSLAFVAFCNRRGIDTTDAKSIELYETYLELWRKENE